MVKIFFIFSCVTLPYSCFNSNGTAKPRTGNLERVKWHRIWILETDSLGLNPGPATSKLLFLFLSFLICKKG